MNQVWRLARRPPQGWPSDGDFALAGEPVPQPADGQALTRTIYLSMDPYQWGRRRSGVEAAGDVCHGRTVSQVVESRTGSLEPGEYVFNTNGWQRYGLTGEGVGFRTTAPRRVDLRTGKGVSVIAACQRRGRRLNSAPPTPLVRRQRETRYSSRLLRDHRDL